MMNTVQEDPKILRLATRAESVIKSVFKFNTFTPGRLGDVLVADRADVLRALQSLRTQGFVEQVPYSADTWRQHTAYVGGRLWPLQQSL